MPGDLVLGYDGTDGAGCALGAACELARDLGAGVVLVFAFQPFRGGGEMRDYEQAVQERAQTILDEGAVQVRAAGLAVRTTFVADQPAEALVAVADREDARMIVVGSYGERPLKSALVGATPTRLPHLSQRPVLVVREPE